MERRKEESIGNVLLRYLRQSQLESPLNEFRILQSWNEIAGSTVAQLTQDIHIYNQKLYVKLRSATMRTELMMKRTELTRKLNQKVGAQVITDIVLSWNTVAITLSMTGFNAFALSGRHYISSCEPRVSLRLPWAKCSIGPSARTCTHASTTILVFTLFCPIALPNIGSQ